MVSHLLFIFVFVQLVSADEEIVDVSHDCPVTTAGTALLRIRADVPAYGEAKCKNGHRLFVPSKNRVEHTLIGSFASDYEGQGCRLHKKVGSNTYTVEVEYGWGEEGSEVILHTKKTTMSCAYDHHGDALSIENKVLESMFAAEEAQVMIGPLNKQAGIELFIMNVLDSSITVKSITLGRKIRLWAKATNNRVIGFHPVSCAAMNGHSSYAFLRAGCGDGVVLKKTSGFMTEGNRATSPFFRSFKLKGSNMMKFQCNFSLCNSNCDGDSCSTEDRKRRDLSEGYPQTDGTVKATLVTATSTNLRMKDDPINKQEEDNPDNIIGIARSDDSLEMWTPWISQFSLEPWTSWMSPHPGDSEGVVRSRESLEKHPSLIGDLTAKFSILLCIFAFILLLSFLMTLYLFVKRLLWHA